MSCTLVIFVIFLLQEETNSKYGYQQYTYL